MLAKAISMQLIIGFYSRKSQDVAVNVHSFILKCVWLEFLETLE